MVRCLRPLSLVPLSVLGLGLFLWVAAPAGGAEPQDPDSEEPADHEHGEGCGGERSHRHGLVHDFSDAESWSSRFDDEARQDWQKPEEVVALMQVAPGMTVVDLGAGTGYFLSWLSAAAGAEGRVLALDPEANMVDFMTRRAAREDLANVEARRIPFDDPELAAGSVDRILIVNTWHHIGDRGAYSAKIRRALKPAGRVYIVDYTRDSPTGPPPEHRLEPSQIIAELEQGGLEARQLEAGLPRQFVVVASLTGER